MLLPLARPVNLVRCELIVTPLAAIRREMGRDNQSVIQRRGEKSSSGRASEVVVRIPWRSMHDDQGATDRLVSGVERESAIDHHSVGTWTEFDPFRAAVLGSDARCPHCEGGKEAYRQKSQDYACHTFFRDPLDWLSDQRPRPSRYPKCEDQGIVELAQLVGRQFAHKVCQSRFLKAHQPITLDCAFMLEAFGRAHENLRWQVVPLREHWGADNRGVIRVDQWRPAHDDEDTCRLWVTGRWADPV